MRGCSQNRLILHWGEKKKKVTQLLKATDNTRASEAIYCKDSEIFS
jgi:hypothetical protein